MTVICMWVDGKMAEVTGTGYDPKGEFRIDGNKADLQQGPGIGTASKLALISITWMIWL